MILLGFEHTVPGNADTRDMGRRLKAESRGTRITHAAAELRHRRLVSSIPIPTKLLLLQEKVSASAEGTLLTWGWLRARRQRTSPPHSHGIPVVAAQAKRDSTAEVPKLFSEVPKAAVRSVSVAPHSEHAALHGKRGLTGARAEPGSQSIPE